MQSDRSAGVRIVGEPGVRTGENSGRIGPYDSPFVGGSLYADGEQRSLRPAEQPAGVGEFDRGGTAPGVIGERTRGPAGCRPGDRVRWGPVRPGTAAEEQRGALGQGDGGAFRFDREVMGREFVGGGSAFDTNLRAVDFRSHGEGRRDTRGRSGRRKRASADPPAGGGAMASSA